MYRLTDRRFEKAKPILERYRRDLQHSGCIDPRSMERELRACWNIGYRELKPIIVDLAKRKDFAGVAAYYNGRMR